MFDPLESLRDVLEAQEMERRRAAAAGRPKIVLNKDSTADEAAAFRALVKLQTEVVEHEVEWLLQQEMTERERVQREILWRFWDDATWMTNADGFLGVFPDGRPKREQHPWHLMLWSIFIGAIMRRATRPAKGSGEDG